MSTTLRVYAKDQGTTVYMDVHIFHDDLLTTDEKKIQTRSVTRALAEALKQVKYTDLGFDNIDIKTVRKRKSTS